MRPLLTICSASALAIAFSVAPASQLATPGQVVQEPPRPATPTRDRQTPTKGSATLKGHVVDAATGQPVRRANVDAYSPDGRGSALTDGEGRFEIPDLPAGKYYVNAMRSGYLRGAFGQRAVDGPGTQIDVLDRQTVDKIVLRLVRGGVISGKVVDEFGDPVVNVEVRPLRYQFQNGARRLTPAFSMSGGSRSTDDLGAFRLYGLAPGQYYVSAQPTESMGGRMPPVAEATTPGLSYFPSSPDPSGAQRVTVAAGRETPGVNISLVSTRVVRVRGRAVLSTGEPFAGGFPHMTQRDEMGGMMFFNRSAPVAADGTFEAVNVAPGRYRLTVRMPNAREEDDPEVGHASVVVAAEDLDNVMIIGSRGAVLRGSFVTDEGVPMPVKAGSLMVHAMPGGNEPFIGMRPPRVQDDYTFEWKGLYGQLRIVSNLMMPPGSVPASGESWAQKAILWRGEDMTDRPFEIEPGQILEGVQIVYSRRWAELSGTVTDDRGNALTDAWLVLFPTDEELWTGQSRHVRATRASEQGVYRFGRLLAGDSFLAAVPEMEPGQEQDPEFLRGLRDRATRIAIADGAVHTQNVRVGQLPQ